MPIVQTGDLNPDLLTPDDRLQVYCGLDTGVTLEVHGEISRELQELNDPGPALIYQFERAMQAPSLDMMSRGFRVDAFERRNAIESLQRRLIRVNSILQRYAQAVWGQPLNPNSPAQLKAFFYGEKGMGLPEVWLNFKGVRRISTNREALEKLGAYFYAIPVINAVLCAKDLAKKISVLQSEVDADGRLRTSYNVAGTETGRWSSSANVWGGGTNLQNITSELRRVFVADRGFKICNLDLQQAESWIVGLLVWQTVGDPTYLNACRSGDLHTTVAKLVWPDITKGYSNDREAVDQVFYRQFTRRDMAKRGGHATNYYGTARTIARHLKVEERVIADFQTPYFRTFPGIPLWHRWTAHQLGLHQCLTTPLGRRRHFFGRPGDDATLREAIAYSPQSVVGDLLNLALWRVWKFLPEVELLAQVHDSIVFQYREGMEETVLPRAMELASIPLTVQNEAGEAMTITIPSDCKVGFNWADDEIKTSRGQTIKNPDGLVKWKPGRNDNRRRTPGLDRIIS